MGAPLRIDVLTLFPAPLEAYLGESMMARAVRQGAAAFRMVNPRDFTTDVHRTVDDRPYGGGPGMVMKPEPLAAALRSVLDDDAWVVHLTPQGVPFRQARAAELAAKRHLVLLCGHYEGIDERVCERFVNEEISIGDYVLTNGVLPAAVVIDAIVRLLPGVVGGAGGTEAESFSTGLLDHPHYTRPEIFEGLPVPPVLLSGDHAVIAKWRAEQARERTLRRRPDLLGGPGNPVP